MTPASTDFFLQDDAQPWQTVGEGIRRKVLTYEASLMLVKVSFEAGSVGALHQHVHTQMSYVESGVFEVVVGDEQRALKAGDTFYAPSNVWHGVFCQEAGVLLDVFTPMREDFV
ncbi:cupin domain-containing protein [Hymenobacter cavernae]|uniref:Cupin n=1 Tax=Hymenobacter cavernae TaxID=2044852 RepID=A0ABQ1TX25_9BACT|nr:cupin domain-containing protein [Hymenobacter cavernae]GGF05800.1 cupin [Hymenobacter cavernae]